MGKRPGRRRRARNARWAGDSGAPSGSLLVLRAGPRRPQTAKPRIGRGKKSRKRSGLGGHRTHTKGWYREKCDAREGKIGMCTNVCQPRTTLPQEPAGLWGERREGKGGGGLKHDRAMVNEQRRGCAAWRCRAGHTNEVGLTWRPPSRGPAAQSGPSDDFGAALRQTAARSNSAAPLARLAICSLGPWQRGHTTKTGVRLAACTAVAPPWQRHPSSTN